MPHVKKDIADKVIERGYATNAGEFAAVIAHEYIKYLKFNGWGFKHRSEALVGLLSAFDEARKYLSKYEDVKAEENGNIFERYEKKYKKQ